MSGSGRKRSSKWDLREESHFETDRVQDNSWPGKESRPGWISPELASDDCSKWSGMETTNTVSKSKQDWELLSKEPLPGARASHKEDFTNKGYNKNMEGTAEWDADKSYNTRMSPGLDGWRRHSSNMSDRIDWSRGRSRSRSWSRSRSRSRSPSHSFKRDSGFHDRNRNRSRVSTQVCRDFASGRCRRGNGCQFLHQDNQNLDDGWESRNRKGGRSLRSTSHDFRDYPRSGRSTAPCTDFVKGRCHRGASCKYPHDSAFHELSRGSPNDISRDRENDRSKEAYFSRGEREPCSSNLVICKFFAAGTCRNGKNCKYSHHSQPRASPERKSSIDRWEDGRERLWDGSKSSELASGSDFTQLREDKNEQIASQEPRYTWPSEQKWGHSLNNESKIQWDQTVGIKAIPGNKNDTILSKAEDTGGCIGTSDPRGHRKWPSDDMEMSPDWHYPVQPSNHVVKGDCNSMQDSGSQTSMALATLSHAIVQEALAKKQDIAVEPITVDNTHFRQNHNLTKGVSIASAFNDKITIDKAIASHAEGKPSGNIILGQRMAYHTDHPGGTVMNPKVADGNFRVKSQEDGSMPGINTGTTITPNVVTSEQITQLTNLSVSLAQYFGNVQPLPQLYASLNTHNVSEPPSFPYSDTPMGGLGASMKTGPVIECSKQHDSTICNSLELKKLEVNKTPLDCLLNSTGQKSVTDVKDEVQIPNLPLSSDPCDKIGISAKETLHESDGRNHGKPAADGEAFREKNGDGDNENKTDPGENEDSQENDTTENANGNDGVHDKKKSKDTKGIRAFKFALVEFVKELLKPTWKEGHISKDVYKTIVKKVVDKVTGTLQGGHIPQTQEKIDHYLSFSKPKLTKLVQAYVDRVQKTT